MPILDKLSEMSLSPMAAKALKAFPYWLVQVMQHKFTMTVLQGGKKHLVLVTEHAAATLDNGPTTLEMHTAFP